MDQFNPSDIKQILKLAVKISSMFAANPCARAAAISELASSVEFWPTYANGIAAMRGKSQACVDDIMEWSISRGNQWI